MPAIDGALMLASICCADCSADWRLMLPPARGSAVNITGGAKESTLVIDVPGYTRTTRPKEAEHSIREHLPRREGLCVPRLQLATAGTRRRAAGGHLRPGLCHAQRLDVTQMAGLVVCHMRGRRKVREEIDGRNRRHHI